MKTLVLGGTTFLGRHLVRRLVERGHETAIFTRGQAAGDENARVRRYVGNRDGALGAIPRDGWDAVIDTSGYVPAIVAASCAHLARARRYCFISSVSVYDPGGEYVGEGRAPYVPRDVAASDDDPRNYGPSKRRAEDVVRTVFDDRALVVRPGLLVGPHDPTNRFTYWVDRFADGGEIAVPGPPQRYVQFADVRDVADFIVLALERDLAGIFDVNGAPRTTTMADVAEAARRTLGNASSLVWIDEAFLEAQGLSGWMDLPLWIGPSQGYPGFMNANVDRALDAGLASRSLDETIADTRAWSRTESPANPSSTIAGITRAHERDLIAAWRAKT